MKNFCITFLLLSIITLTGVGFFINSNHQKGMVNTEYLRIHVRADDNSQQAQAVKYKVKDKVVEFLTPLVCQVNSKEQAKEMLTAKKQDIKKVVDNALHNYGFNYTSTVKIQSEEFPLRTYEGFTLEGGIYDALIIELGSGKGDNWWCVVYPPLCFTDEDKGANYTYKSKIAEIIKDFREKLKREEK